MPQNYIKAVQSLCSLCDIQIQDIPIKSKWLGGSCPCISGDTTVHIRGYEQVTVGLVFSVRKWGKCNLKTSV